MKHNGTDFDLGEETSRSDQLAKQWVDEAQSFVMADPRGRRFIRWVMAVSGEDQSVSCDNALRQARLSGRRDVGLEIHNALEAALPDRWDELVKEGRSDRAELNSLRNDDSSDF